MLRTVPQAMAFFSIYEHLGQHSWALQTGNFLHDCKVKRIWVGPYSRSRGRLGPLRKNSGRVALLKGYMVRRKRTSLGLTLGSDPESIEKGMLLEFVFYSETRRNRGFWLTRQGREVIGSAQRCSCGTLQWLSLFLMSLVCSVVGRSFRSYHTADPS